MFSKVVAVLLLGTIVSAVPPRYSRKYQRLEQAPVPHTVYGPPTEPPQEYGPPPQEYGPPPQEVTTEQQDVTTAELPTTESPTDADNRLRELKNGQNRGVYYIYHPDGVLQKVVYATKDDLKRMEYSANLKYETVQPIRDPIYTYDPKTYVFKRVAV